MGFAIIPNPEIRARFDEELNGTMASYNVMTLAAYRKLYDGSCDQWKEDLREQLRKNRDRVEQWVEATEGITVPHNEATYLAFLDCSGLGLEDPADFFLKKAKVLLSSGEMYGDKTCVRLNYGCSPGQLEEALTRMGNALKKER
jgi:cystathionine beta-lyase